MNKDKFKELSLKQKIEWLVHYYGVAFIVGLVALIVAIVFIRSVFFPEPLSDICVLILSDDVTSDDAFALQSIIEEKTGKTSQVSAYNTTDMYGRQSFSAKLTADELDIIVAPEEETMGMLDNKYLIRYEKVENKNLYIGTSFRAREGQLLEDTYIIVKEYIEDEE